MKAWTIFAVVVLLAGIFLARSIRPVEAYVVEVDEQADEVVVCTASGELYAFYGADGFCAGDHVECVMFDATPGNACDDAIIGVRPAE